MNNFFARYPVEGGVISLNGLTGALTLVAGTNISIVASGTSITISSTGSGGVDTINGDAHSAQTLTVGTAGTDFAIVDNGLGNHLFNLPTASAVNRGALSSADWTTFNNKQNALGPFTSGSVIFSNGTTLVQDNANFFWNDTNFSLGIGMNTPASNAFIDGVNSSGATKRIQIAGYGNSVGFRGKYANGTLGSPTAAVNTNVLAFLSAQGYGTTGFPAASTALINMTAAATFTDSSMPTDVNILTTPTGSITAVQTVLFSHTGATTLGASGNTAVHQFNGGINYTSKTITANYTVDTTATDHTILCNAAGAITVTLPTPTAGRRLEIKDISGAATANNITIARHAAEKIEGLAASYVLLISYGTIILHSDGTDWWIIG